MDGRDISKARIMNTRRQFLIAAPAGLLARSALRDRIGPVNAAEFAIDVELKDKVPPQSFSMQIDGKGNVGFTKGTATVVLEEQPGPLTVMTYNSDVQIGGRIAAVGGRLLESVGRMMTRQALDALNAELKARL